MKLFRWIRNLFRRKKPAPRPVSRKPDVLVPTTMELRKINKAGLELVKHFEGYYSKAYKCPAGVWTIGYGTIRYPNGDPVYRGHECTELEASYWLKYELAKKAQTVQRFLHNWSIELNDNEFSALVSFCYNLGTGPLVESHRSLHQAITTDLNKVPDAMRLYVKAGGKTLRGLVRRREAEVELWES